MKTLLHKIALFSLAAILFTGILNSCGEDKVEEKKGEKEMTRVSMALLYDEEIIELGNNAMDTVTGRARRRAIVDSILIDHKYRIFDTAAVIGDTSLLRLRGYAQSLQGSDTGKYVLGFAMTYGLNTTNKKIKLFYKPVYIKKISPSGLKANAQYSLVPGPDFYQYTSGNFEKVDKTLAKTFIQSYRDHIRFKDTANHSGYIDTIGWRKFVDTDDISGDVKFVIYPFQETDSILEANQVRSIYIFHIGEYKSGYFKHGLLLGFEGLGVDKQIFYAKYGNLSHLCPPSCNTITLNVK